MSEKRVQLRRSNEPVGEPNTHRHADPDEYQAWIEAARDAGELIHLALLVVRNEKLGLTTPYALCDQANDLFPDPAKFVATGLFPDENISCPKCRKLKNKINAGEWNPFEEVG